MLKFFRFIGIMALCLIVILFIARIVNDADSKVDLVTFQTDWDKCIPHGNEVVVAKVIKGQMSCEFHEFVGYGQYSSVLPHSIQLASPL